MSTQVEEHVGQDWAENDPELRPVAIAIVGAGYWGRNLVRNALQSPATRLTAAPYLDNLENYSTLGRAHNCL